LIFGYLSQFEIVEYTRNATAVDDSIRFVSDSSKDKGKMESSESNDIYESNEPDYDEDEDQLEEEQEGEEMTFWSEITF
jgi:hypothetical protein